jgi:hypothetical protein
LRDNTKLGSMSNTFNNANSSTVYQTGTPQSAWMSI